MSLSITVFDGADTIGGTKIHITDEHSALLGDLRGLFLDFGVNYERWGKYYEEYLEPRGTQGIKDLLILNLVPPIRGLYRSDLFPVVPAGELPELSIEAPCDAVIVSHAHLDHCGHIGLIRTDVPIYTSLMTAILMKAIQDSSSSEFDKEMVYITPRQPEPADHRILKATGWRDMPFQGRQFYITDGKVSENIKEFWELPPNPAGTGRLLDSKPLATITSDRKLQTFRVDHSILGACAYIIETSCGWLIYTGDLRLHGKAKQLTEEFIEAAASKLPSKILLMEGTNVDRETETSEAEVYESCLREVKAAAGKLVVADFAPRDIERLSTFLEIAEATSRQLVILTKDAYILEAIEKVDSSSPQILSRVCIFEGRKANYMNWEKRIMAEYKSKYVAPEAISRSQGAYILCFSFFDLKHLLDITPKEGGIYIYSSSEAFSEEQVIDFQRLYNWLTILKLKPIGFYIDAAGKLYFMKGYHASGHLPSSQICQIIKSIAPKYLIPVHTQNPNFFLEQFAKICKVILPEAGKPINIKA